MAETNFYSIVGLAKNELERKLEMAFVKVVREEKKKVLEEYCALADQHGDGLISNQEMLNAWVDFLATKDGNNERAEKVVLRMAEAVKPIAQKCENICLAFAPKVWNNWVEQRVGTLEMVNFLIKSLGEIGAPL